MKKINIKKRGKMHLRREERALLWKKYQKLGLSKDQANDRLDKFVNYLNNLVDKLKAKGKSKDEINIKFREEFEKLCMKLET